MTKRVGRLTAVDITAAAQLYQTVFSQAPWFETHALSDVSQYISRLLAMNTNRCYAIWEAKQLIGVALGFSKPWHRGVEYQLLDLFVAVDQQKKGVGTLLLEMIKADLSAADIPHIILETEKGTPAEQFYYHNGFTLQPDQRALTLVSTTAR